MIHIIRGSDDVNHRYFTCEAMSYSNASNLAPPSHTHPPLPPVQVEKWNDENKATTPNPTASAARTPPDVASPILSAIGNEGAIQHPEHLVPSSSFTPSATSASTIITPSEASALAAGIPGRHHMANWSLLYSTDKDGFSLQSMYRAGASAARSMLLVKDFNEFVFGAYCTQPWRVKARYQGSGECFVFQMRPHAVKYSWLQAGVSEAAAKRNDFFMLFGQDSAGFGGAPHFAIWLDSDLLYGNSGLSDTFASPVLSGSADFKVKALELWQVGK
jgi:hypothetical protein